MRRRELEALTVPVANCVENPDAVMVEVQHELPVEENRPFSVKRFSSNLINQISSKKEKL